MLNLYLKWIKLNSLLFKMLLITLLIIAFIMLIISYFSYRHTKSNQFKYYIEIGDYISEFLNKKINEDSFGQYNLINWNRYCEEVVAPYPIVNQLNLISINGQYLSSTQKGNTGRTASIELINLFQNKIDFVQLTPINLSSNEGVINVWLYLNEITANKVNEIIYLQILFDGNLISNEFSFIKKNLIYLALIMVFLFFITVIIFHKLIRKNIINISKINLKSNILNNNDLDGEFSLINKKLSTGLVENQKLKTQIEEYKAKQKLKNDTKNDKADVFSVEHFNQLFIGVKITNFDKSISNLNYDQFATSISKIYNFYLNIIKKYDGNIIYFDGQIMWCLLKGEEVYKKSMKIINNIKNKSNSFSEEYQCEINQALNMIFYINKGNINLVNLNVGKNKFLSVLGGNEMNKSMNQLAQMDKGDIWANSSLKNNYQNICYISEITGESKFWDDFKDNLIILSFDPLTTKKSNDLKTEKSKLASVEQSIKSSGIGITDILDDTLNQ